MSLKLFNCLFFGRTSLSEQRYVNSDNVKNQFWHICYIFALNFQETLKSEKRSQHSYQSIHLSLNPSQKSKISTDHCFQRSLLQKWHSMTGIPLCVVPEILWWVLESTPLVQSDAVHVFFYNIIDTRHEN